MSSVDATPRHEGRPSVFLSYASEDRSAVRKLRDALVAAGVDAWYDENELTGGDAWDAKIRRQIRECTYFMPVISARASARLEGYFRREWRFALERMLDMADDVVFLLPVVIDDSHEGSARVPEKFLTVQWLRLPDGDATSAFNDLARRLAAGGAERLHHAPRNGGPRPTPPPRATPHYLPPAEEELPRQWWRWPGFFWKKIPRWMRVILWFVIIIWALDRCSNCGNTNSNPGTQSAARKAAKQKTTPAKSSAPDTPADLAAVMTTVGKAIEQVGAVAKNAAENSTAKAGSDVLILTQSNARVASAVQNDLFRQFIMATGVQVLLSPHALKQDETLLARARAEGARFVAHTTLEKNEAGEDILRVVLLRSADGAQLSLAEFPATERPSLVTAQAYAQFLPLVLKKD